MWSYCNSVYCSFLFLKGKAFTSIEPTETKINDLCVVKDTGMLFLANEAPKILTYYVPVSSFLNIGFLVVEQIKLDYGAFRCVRSLLVINVKELQSLSTQWEPVHETHSPGGATTDPVLGYSLGIMLPIATPRYLQCTLRLFKHSKPPVCQKTLCCMPVCLNRDWHFVFP